MSPTVQVSGISSQTSEKEVRDFFSFCGKISSLSVKPTSEGGDQSATVTFEKETAAKTALLLDNTQLGPAQVHVSSSASLDDLSGKAPDDGAGGDEVTQEDKPRSRILAEYLAHGYTISDKVIERGIALDNQHGISTRFTNALKNFDAKYKASDKAKAVDQQYQVSGKVAAGWSGLNSYFEKALDTPTGQKVRSFYQQGNKQAVDVHNEARHLANLKGGKSDKFSPESVPGDNDRTTCKCGAESGKCGCAPGTCACSSCAKNPEADVGKSVDKEKAEMEQVSGTDKTKCNCGATAEKCPCEPGKCACAKCDKNPEN